MQGDVPARNKRFDRPTRQQHSERRADRGEHHAFRKKLANQRPRVAPSANRTVTSVLRATARASNKFPTFAHAISSTNATTQENMQRLRITESKPGNSCAAVEQLNFIFSRDSLAFSRELRTALLVRSCCSAIVLRLALARALPLAHRPIKLTNNSLSVRSERRPLFDLRLEI